MASCQVSKIWEIPKTDAKVLHCGSDIAWRKGSRGVGGGRRELGGNLGKALTSEMTEGVL